MLVGRLLPRCLELQPLTQLVEKGTKPKKDACMDAETVCRDHSFKACSILEAVSFKKTSCASSWCADTGTFSAEEPSGFRCDEPSIC